MDMVTLAPDVLDCAQFLIRSAGTQCKSLFLSVIQIFAPVVSDIKTGMGVSGEKGFRNELGKWRFFSLLFFDPF